MQPASLVAAKRWYEPDGQIPGDPAQAGDHRQGFVEDQAGLGLGVAASRPLDPKTAALVRVEALVAIGSPEVCPEWSTTRALAAGASEDEVTDVLAIAPVARLGRVTGAVPGVAAALGYDVEAALMDSDDH